MIWVSNNYFAWEVILDIEIWINDCEDENEKYINEWIYLSLCMCNFFLKMNTLNVILVWMRVIDCEIIMV